MNRNETCPNHLRDLGKLQQQQSFKHFKIVTQIEISTQRLHRPGEVAILVRKRGGNPVDYFDKTFAEYEEGFESKGTFPH